MFKVPEHAKELINTDGVHKNLSISFPDNDIEEITNEKLDAESLKYVQSICSKKDFKFGLCEASSISFTAHNIPDVTGEKIKANLQLDEEVEVRTVTTDENGKLSFNFNEVKAKKFRLLGYLPIGSHGSTMSWETITGIEVSQNTSEAIRSEYRFWDFTVPDDCIGFFSFSIVGMLPNANFYLFTYYGDKPETDTTKKRELVAEIQDKMTFDISELNLASNKVVFAITEYDMLPTRVSIVATYTIGSGSYEKTYNVTRNEYNDGTLEVELDYIPTETKKIKLSFDTTMIHFKVETKFVTYAEKETYNIPLGTYIVSECKKNSDDATVMQVKALEPIAYKNWNALNPFMKMKFEFPTTSNADLEQSYEAMLLCEFPDYFNSMSGAGLGIDYYGDYLFNLGTDYYVYIRTRAISFDTDSVDKCYRFECDKIRKTAFYDAWYQLIDKSKELRLDEIDKLYQEMDYYYNKYKNPICGYGSLYSRDNIQYDSFINREVTMDSNVFAIYPYMTVGTRETISAYIKVCKEIRLMHKTSTGDEVVTSYNVLSGTPKCKRYTIKNILKRNMIIKKQRGEVIDEHQTFVPNIGYPITDVFNAITSFFELQGGFGQYDRYGNFNLKTLQYDNFVYPSPNTFPKSTTKPRNRESVLFHIDMSMYSKCYHLDEMTKPYARVVCEYNTGDSSLPVQKLVYWLIDQKDYTPEKYQDYDITNNFFIKNFNYSESEIAAYMQTIADKLYNISYLPCSIKMRGLPNLEAGDLMIIESKGMTFKTYAMRRELNGIQVLQDSISSM